MIAHGGAHTSVEVALVDGADGEKDIELRSLVWGEGVGWYRQQTLTLDSSEVTALMRALGTAQARLRPLPSTSPARALTPWRRVDPPDRADIALPAAPTRLKATCCKRYERKGRACKRCPHMAGKTP